MVDLKTAWLAPIRRIYLVWGIVLIVGFILSGLGFGLGYRHWYVLTLIGLSTQVIKMRLNTWKPRLLLVMWAWIAFGGTLENQLTLSGLIPAFPLVVHFQFFWLSLMSIPQIITGKLLGSKFQMALGALWLIIGLSFMNFGWDDFYSFVFVAILTGIPYLYIAFKR